MTSHTHDSDPRFAAMYQSKTFKSSRQGANPNAAKARKTASKGSGQGSHKVLLDERFKGVLTDERFVSVDSASKVDKYGREVKKTVGAANHEMAELYETGMDETLPEGRDSVSGHEGLMQGMDVDSRIDYLNKLARGELGDEDESSGDESSIDDSASIGSSREKGKSLISQFYSRYQQESIAPLDGEEVEAPSTTRLAVQNCDWDNFRAVDLL